TVESVFGRVTTAAEVTIADNKAVTDFDFPPRPPPAPTGTYGSPTRGTTGWVASPLLASITTYALRNGRTRALRYNFGTRRKHLVHQQRNQPRTSTRISLCLLMIGVARNLSSNAGTNGQQLEPSFLRSTIRR